MQNIIKRLSGPIPQVVPNLSHDTGVVRRGLDLIRATDALVVVVPRVVNDKMRNRVLALPPSSASGLSHYEEAFKNCREKVHGEYFVFEDVPKSTKIVMVLGVKINADILRSTANILACEEIKVWRVESEELFHTAPPIGFVEPESGTWGIIAPIAGGVAAEKVTFLMDGALERFLEVYRDTTND